jgi:WD40 repeat protein
LPHQGRVLGVVFSPDGSALLTGSGDGTGQLWETSTGKPVGPPLRHHGPLRGLAFSPDGKTVLTGSDDGTARLWDVATGRPLGPAFRHRDKVLAVTFAPFGEAVLTGSADCTARLWKVPGSIEGNPGWLNLRFQIQTGAELDATGALRGLDASTLTLRARSVSDGWNTPARRSRSGL